MRSSRGRQCFTSGLHRYLQMQENGVSPGSRVLLDTGSSAPSLALCSWPSLCSLEFPDQNPRLPFSFPFPYTLYTHSPFLFWLHKFLIFFSPVSGVNCYPPLLWILSVLVVPFMVPSLVWSSLFWFHVLFAPSLFAKWFSCVSSCSHRIQFRFFCTGSVLLLLPQH